MSSMTVRVSNNLDMSGSEECVEAAYSEMDGIIKYRCGKNLSGRYIEIGSSVYGDEMSICQVQAFKDKGKFLNEFRFHNSKFCFFYYYYSSYSLFK